jgi:hypothetical protein
MAQVRWPPAIPAFLGASFWTSLVNAFSGGPAAVWLAVPLALMGGVSLARRRAGAAILLTCVALTPFLSLLFLELHHAFSLRYFSFLLPFALLLVAEGLVAFSGWAVGVVPGRIGSRMRGATTDRLVLAALLTVLCVLWIAPLRGAYRQGKPNDWRGLAGFIEQHAEGGTIMGEAWFDGALPHYLSTPGRWRLLPEPSFEALEEDLASSPAWFIGLKGPAERETAARYAPVDPAEWRDERFPYSHDVAMRYGFAGSEPEASLYRLDARGPAGTFDFRDIADAGWTDVSYSVVTPGSLREIVLSRPAGGAYAVALRYLDYLGGEFEIWVEGERVAVIGGGDRGWQTWIGRLPGSGSGAANVGLRATGSKDAAFDLLEILPD